MIETFLESAFVAYVGVPLATVVSAALLVWLAEASPVRGAIQSCKGVVAPFFTVVSILFGLFAAFAANDVWTRAGHAKASVQSEAEGLRTLMSLADAIGPHGAPIRQAVKEYVQAVLDREWPAMAEARRAPGARKELDAVFALIASPPPGAAPPLPVQAAMLAAAAEVSHARMERRNAAVGHLAPSKMLTVLLFGVLTQASLVAVHLGARRPMIMALALFSAGMALTLVVLDLHDRPFANIASPVQPTPLVNVLSAGS